MRKLLFSATCLASWLVFLSTAVVAQAPQRALGPPANPNAGFDPGANRAPAHQASRGFTPIAVIDLLHVFEHHPGFQDKKVQMDRLKENKERELLGKRDALKAKLNQLKELDLKPGTAEFSQRESELAGEEAKLQIEVKKANQDFIILEGKMYWETYQQVLEVIKAYALQRNISVVMRYTGAEVHPENPEEVMKELNEQVVFYNEAADITDDIVNHIKSQYPQQRIGRQPTAPISPQRSPLR